MSTPPESKLMDSVLVVVYIRICLCYIQIRKRHGGVKNENKYCLRKI